MATRLRALTTAIVQIVGEAVSEPAKEKASRRGRVVTILVFSLVIWSVIAWLGAQLLIVKSELVPADVIVVLGGSSTYLERADWAARLYQEGRAPVIVLTNDGAISGWNQAEQRNPYFYELASRELQQRGVPATKIVVIPAIVSSTYEESLELRDYAMAHKLRRLQVVTSAYHSRRALWSFRRAFEGSDIDVGVDGPPPGWQTPPPASWWLSRRGWKVVAGEYAKIIYYWVRY